MGVLSRAALAVAEELAREHDAAPLAVGVQPLLQGVQQFLNHKSGVRTMLIEHGSHTSSGP